MGSDNRSSRICTDAEELRRRINAVDSSSGRNHAKLFLRLQLCILNRLCAGECCASREDAEWLNNVVHSFMQPLFGALDGEIYPENEAWESVLDEIDALSGPGRNIMPRVLGPDGGRGAYAGMQASTDLISGQTALDMAQVHIGQDLEKALKELGVGSDTNWACVGNAVTACERQFLTRPGSVMSRAFLPDVLRVDRVRDQMRDDLKSMRVPRRR